MKKILFVLLLLLRFVRFDVYGESYTIPLTYQISPTYVVSIPKVLDISDNNTSFAFSATGDIYYDYQLEVLFEDSTIITNGFDSSVVYITQDKNMFNYEELINTSTSQVYLSHDELSSGTWTGALKLSITLKEGA